MSIRSGLLTAVFTALAAPAIAQQPCLHDANESPEQSVRRRQALQATRTVNNIEANQPGWPTGVYLKHEELSWSLEVHRLRGFAYISNKAGLIYSAQHLR
jgi:hypothetical protein